MSIKSAVAASGIVLGLGIGSTFLALNLAQATPVGNAYEIVSTSDTWSGQDHTTTATCPSGSVAVGGGYSAPGATAGTTVTQLQVKVDAPLSDASGWQVRGGVWSGLSITVYAVCAPVL